MAAAEDRVIGKRPASVASGEPLRVVARALGVSVGQAGKITYLARLRLRRTLPRDVTEAFLAVKPAPAFVRRVQAGVFDEFVGEYRFPTRSRGPHVDDFAFIHQGEHITART